MPELERSRRFAIISLAVLTLGGPAVARGEAEEERDEGVEVLTKGPVHESFAAPTELDPTPGPFVAREPPAAIDELPPDQRPEGDDVRWIPGYWAWDDERIDFVWVSGVWRDVPPGRRWIPGRFAESPSGHQWVSGYWAPEAGSETYVQAPPARVENGPSSDAPSTSSLWVSGAWMWRDRWLWRTGYWIAAEPDWLWMPAHYVWTPRGYVFVDGYWDYGVSRRGVLFAPVYFHAGVVRRVGFRWSPWVVVYEDSFFEHLFSRPRHHQYYFGDYYAAEYIGRGYHPWFEVRGRTRTDALWIHYRWSHAREPRFEERVRERYTYRREHQEARPAATWTIQQQRAVASPQAPANMFVGRRLADVVADKKAVIRYQPLDATKRAELAHGAPSTKALPRSRPPPHEEERTLREATPHPAQPTKPLTTKPREEPAPKEEAQPPQTKTRDRPDAKEKERPRDTKPRDEPDAKEEQRPRDTKPRDEPDAKEKERPRAAKPDAKAKERKKESPKDAKKGERGKGLPKARAKDHAR